MCQYENNASKKLSFLSDKYKRAISLLQTEFDMALFLVNKKDQVSNYKFVIPEFELCRAAFLRSL